MNRAVRVARFSVGLFGTISLIGLIWFNTSLSGAMVAAGIVVVLASIFAAVVPNDARDGGLRGAMVLACSLGIASLVAMSVDQFIKSQSIEWDVEIIRVLHIAAFSVIAAGLARIGSQSSTTTQ